MPVLAAVLGSRSVQPEPVKRGMIVRSTRAEDLEMPPEGFLESYITPVERFFVRSHHYVPTVNLFEWKLKVEGSVTSPLELTMDELRKLPRVETVSVLECAGNGRGFYEPSMPGLQWRTGSVGNAKWAGVRLVDVLRKAGAEADAVEVLFDGADVPVGKQPEFQRGIPFRKAIDPNTLLAFEMNGAPLAAAHGFPLRVVAQGWAGDCWVKWLTRIEVRSTESEGFFMKTAYRHPGKPVPPGTAVDPAQMKPVTTLQIKSVIASHSDGQDIPLTPQRIRGAAWSNESPVAAVEVSVDGGRSWKPARIGVQPHRFGWRQWEFDWTPKEPAYYTIMSRARNVAGETQPVVQEWNPSGYQWNVTPMVRLIATATPRAAGNGGRAGEIPPEPPAFYRNACLTCHGEEAIAQQRLTRTQWEREVEKMRNWGAPVTAENRDVLVEFLTRRFGR